MEELLELIKAECKDRELSVRKLCDEVGVPWVTVYKWLAHETDPKLSHVENLLDKLGYELKINRKENHHGNRKNGSRY